MSLVLDSSVTIAWVYLDEMTSAVQSVLERVTERGAWVPGLWRLEIANVLQVGVVRKRYDAAFREATLADLALLPIQTDPDTSSHAWAATMRLAERHRLTLYDASYLELALRRGLPLATLDRELVAAAIAEKVEVLGE